MFAHRIGVFLIVFVGLAQAGTVQAQQNFKAFINRALLDAQRNNCWPQTFAPADRQAARAPFERMVAKAWESQNLLGDHHFNQQTNELSESGKLKITNIVRHLPTHHRIIFVSRTESPEQTAARVDAVQNFAIALVHTGNLAPVRESDAVIRGWPGTRVDLISRKFDEAAPVPELPDASKGSAGVGG